MGLALPLSLFKLELDFITEWRFAVLSSADIYDGKGATGAVIIVWTRWPIYDDRTCQNYFEATAMFYYRWALFSNFNCVTSCISDNLFTRIYSWTVDNIDRIYRVNYNCTLFYTLGRIYSNNYFYTYKIILIYLFKEIINSISLSPLIYATILSKYY